MYICYPIRLNHNSIALVLIPTPIPLIIITILIELLPITLPIASHPLPNVYISIWKLILYKNTIPTLDGMFLPSSGTPSYSA